MTYLSSVGEKGRLLIVLFDSLAVKVDCAGVITRLEGLVALVLEFDGVHFCCQSSRSVEWASQKQAEGQRRGRGSLFGSFAPSAVSTTQVSRKKRGTWF